MLGRRGPPHFLPLTSNTEREGFEPSIGVDPLCRFSKPVPSATRPPLQALRSKQLNRSPPAGGTPAAGDTFSGTTPNRHAESPPDGLHRTLDPPGSRLGP